MRTWCWCTAGLLSSSASAGNISFRLAPQPMTQPTQKQHPTLFKPELHATHRAPCPWEAAVPLALYTTAASRQHSWWSAPSEQYILGAGCCCSSFLMPRPGGHLVASSIHGGLLANANAVAG
eukprot:GHRQ01011590.1.p2 GENE.GHRQ01011590.1~~GHRQ01011590.1.p2  ORF type:complete len:122 (-),score=29.43 GHRQ01011590.1:598-963(-)